MNYLWEAWRLYYNKNMKARKLSRHLKFSNYVKIYICGLLFEETRYLSKKMNAVVSASFKGMMVAWKLQ